MALKRILELLTLQRMRNGQDVTRSGADAETVEVATDAAIPASQLLTALQIRYAELEAENQALKARTSGEPAESAEDQSSWKARRPPPRPGWRRCKRSMPI